MFKNRVAKNAFWIIGIQIVKSLLGLVISMITARYLGPANYGLFNYASSLVAFVAPIMYLGLTGILVQELINAQDEEGTVLGTAVIMSLVSSVLCIAGLLGFVFVANQGETETIIVCAFYSVLLIFEGIDLIQYWFQAKLQSKYSSLASLVAYVVVSFYKIFLLVTAKSVRWFAISSSVEYFAVAIGLYYLYKRLGGQKLCFSWNKARQMLSRSHYYIVADMMVAIFAQTDRIMLKLMVDNTATGYYSAAVACAGMTSFVFSAIIDSFRPLIFEKKKLDEAQFEKNMCRLYSIIIYLSLAQSLCMSLFAPLIIKIIYGSAYGPAASALSLVVWYTTFSYLGAVRNIWMLSENLQRYLGPINIIGALSNVVLNLIIIPIMGIMGAALASIITQFFTNVLLGFIIKPLIPNNQLMLKSLELSYIKEIVKEAMRKTA